MYGASSLISARDFLSEVCVCVCVLCVCVCVCVCVVCTCVVCVCACVCICTYECAYVYIVFVTEYICTMYIHIQSELYPINELMHLL